MQSKLKLNPSEKLVQVRHRSKGTMAQMDIYYYNIVNEAEEVVGEVIYEDHTAIDFRGRTQHVTQKDNEGNTIVQESW